VSVAAGEAILRVRTVIWLVRLLARHGLSSGR
jgi:hypothetical protein